VHPADRSASDRLRHSVRRRDPVLPQARPLLKIAGQSGPSSALSSHRPPYRFPRCRQPLPRPAYAAAEDLRRLDAGCAPQRRRQDVALDGWQRRDRPMNSSQRTVPSSAVAALAGATGVRSARMPARSSTSRAAAISVGCGSQRTPPRRGLLVPSILLILFADDPDVRIPQRLTQCSAWHFRLSDDESR
jgi:hypothetical protein